MDKNVPPMSSSNCTKFAVKQRHILLFLMVLLLLLVWVHERSARLALATAVEKAHRTPSNDSASEIVRLHESPDVEDNVLTTTSTPVIVGEGAGASEDPTHGPLPNKRLSVTQSPPLIQSSVPSIDSRHQQQSEPSPPPPPWTKQQPPQPSGPGAYMVWSEVTCYQQSLITSARSLVSIVHEYCPSLLPSGGGRTPSSLEAGARQAAETHRRPLAAHMHAQKHERQQQNQLPQQYVAKIMCRFLNHSGCAFVHRGKMKIVRKEGSGDGDAFPPPFPLPPSISSVPGRQLLLTNAEETTTKDSPPISLIDVIDEMLANKKSAAFVSGFRSCNTSSSCVGLLSQSLSLSLKSQLRNKGTANDETNNDMERLKQRFALTTRQSSSYSGSPPGQSASAAPSASASLNTIKWLSWRPEKCEDGKLAGPKIPKRPSPTAYRDPLEILATIRAFHQQRLFKGKMMNSDSPPRILFTGDSQCRQKFMRLVQLLRGEEVIPHTHPRRAAQNGRRRRPITEDKPVMEHYLHGDVRYRLFDNGEDQMDALHENMADRGDRVWNMSAFEDVQEMFDSRRVQSVNLGTPRFPTEWYPNADAASQKLPPPSGTVVLQLDFMWSVHRHPHAFRVATTRSGRIGAGYSLHIHDNNFSNLTQSMSGILNALMNNKADDARHVTVIMPAAFPTRTFPGIVAIEKSNNELKQFCSAAKTRQKNIFCLDFDGVSSMLTGGLNEPPREARCDELHFMLNFIPFWPNTLEGMKRAYCPNNPLRDDVNAATVQVLIDHLPLFHGEK